MIPTLQTPVGMDELIASIKNITSNGKATPLFEESFKKFIDCRHVIFTDSGLSALYTLLNAYNITSGDEVLVPGYICETVVRLLLDFGLKINFVDVELDSYNINPESLKENITINTKVVLMAHMFGNPCNTKAITEICSDHKILLLEDSAQCIGAEIKGQKVGSFGDASFFSFNNAKPMTTLGGGMITTNDSDIYSKSRKIINSFKERSLRHSISVFAQLGFYTILKNKTIYHLSHYLIEKRRKQRWSSLQDIKGLAYLSYKPHDLHSAIGLSQVKKINHFNKIREKNTTFLVSKLSKLEGLTTPKFNDNVNSFFLRLPVLTESREVRDYLKNQLLLNGIEASIGYPNYLPEYFGIDNDCPNCKTLVDTTLTLPTHPLVNKNDLENIFTVLENSYKTIT